MKQGTVVRPSFGSSVLKGNPLGDPVERITPVYLPPSYQQEPKRRYPVLYAIAGFTGNGRMMLNESFLDETMDARLDRLIGTGAMGEAIVVMPDCITRYGGSQFIDSEATGRYGEYLLDEIVGWVDASFRTIPSRDARGIFGKSSGGFGAIRAAMDRPEVIGAFACHSGDMGFEYCYLGDCAKALRYLWKMHLSPKRFLEEFPKAVKKSGDIVGTLNALAMAACYSPNPDAEAGFDLPFDLRTGELIDDVWQRWLAHDPVRLIPSRLEQVRSQRLVFLDCGTRDEWLIDIGTRWGAHLLREGGIPVVHEEFDDGHTGISYRYDRSLPMLTEALLPPE